MRSRLNTLAPFSLIPALLHLETRTRPTSLLSVAGALAYVDFTGILLDLRRVKLTNGVSTSAGKTRASYPCAYHGGLGDSSVVLGRRQGATKSVLHVPTNDPDKPAIALVTMVTFPQLRPWRAHWVPDGSDPYHLRTRHVSIALLIT